MPDVPSSRTPPVGRGTDDGLADHNPNGTGANGNGANGTGANGTSGAAADQGRRFGEYELLGEVARGGMGVVFRARQVRLNRVVALKMILSGNLAGPEDIRRFQVEAEAAAGLDHPNIVPIYEVGEQDGQHYFSMGFVEGESLADMVRDHPLPARRAAHIARTVAEAVEYAHGRGVVHRDLKPANVLVDREGNPRVTDFGLAKRADGAELTATGTILGTPSYMPPEQALGQHGRVGPHSDVYALGAVLYCLLTGRPPFQSASLLETLKQVRDQEPVPPRQLNPEVPVDLETICLKCLAKEPPRRYLSARELADDLGRFLDGLPVKARPVGRAERLRRWCRRNPVIAGLAAAVLVSLVAGTAVSTYYAIMASRRAVEAEQNYRAARQAVDDFFVRVSNDTLLNQPGMQPLQHELLEQALVYYREFLRDRGDDPELRDELAATHYRVGLITEAIESPKAALPALNQARQIQETLVRATPQDTDRLQALGATLTALGRVRFDSSGPAAAEEPWRRALEIRERLSRMTGGEPEAQRELANAHMNLGLIAAESRDDADARATARRAFETAQEIRRDVLEQKRQLPRDVRLNILEDFGKGWFNLGGLPGDPNASLTAYRQAADAFEQVVRADPVDQENRRRLALCYRVLADHAREAAASGSPAAKAEADKAIELYGRAAAELRTLHYQNPQLDDYARDLASAEMLLGDTFRERSNAEKAAAAYQAAWQALEPLVEAPDAPAERLIWAAQLQQSLGTSLHQAGDPAAGAALASAHSWWQTVRERGAFRPEFLFDEAIVAIEQADLERQQGRHAAAETAYRHGLARLHELEQAGLGSGNAILERSRAIRGLAELARLSNEPPRRRAAAQRLHQMLQELERMTAAIGPHPVIKAESSKVRQLLGELSDSANHPPQPPPPAIAESAPDKR